MSQVGIVIPVFGRFDLLQECIQALPGGVPIYLVDDCTSDVKERKLIKDFAHDNRYRYFSNDENMGFPYTVNKGMSKSMEPLMLILNSDVILRGGAIQVLTDEFEDPSVGVAGPMLIFPHGSEYGPEGRVQHVGIVFNIMAQPVHLFIGWDTGNPRVRQRRDTLQAITGACMMVRRRDWKQIGGFAPVYGRGTYEDVELCVLIKNIYKRKIVCNTDAVGWHYVGQSAKSSGGFSLKQNQSIFYSRVGNLIRNDDYLYL